MHSLAQLALVALALLAATAIGADAPSTQPAPAKPIFEDNFDNLDNWVAEGPFTRKSSTAGFISKLFTSRRKTASTSGAKKNSPPTSASNST